MQVEIIRVKTCLQHGDIYSIFFVRSKVELMFVCNSPYDVSRTLFFCISTVLLLMSVELCLSVILLTRVLGLYNKKKYIVRSFVKY